MVAKHRKRKSFSCSCRITTIIIDHLRQRASESVNELASSSSSTTIASGRHEAFVGRKSEKDRLTQWIHANTAPTKLIAVTGIGGIGKSTFLDMALQRAEQLGAYTAWIDGRACFGTPDGLLRYVPRKFLEWVRNPDDSRWVLASITTNGYAILMAGCATICWGPYHPPTCSFLSASADSHCSTGGST